MEGYLDARLIGQRWQLTAQNMTDGVTFFGISYHVRATEPLHAGDLVEVIRADAHGLVVTVVTPHH